MEGPSILCDTSPVYPKAFNEGLQKSFDTVCCSVLVPRLTRYTTGEWTTGCMKNWLGYESKYKCSPLEGPSWAPVLLSS